MVTDSISFLQGFLFTLNVFSISEMIIVSHQIRARVGIWLYGSYSDLLYHWAVWHMIQQSPVLPREMQTSSYQWLELCRVNSAGRRSDPIMAARQQKPAAASDGSAEAKRTDFRANEKKCCEWFAFFSLCVPWRWNVDCLFCSVLMIELCSSLYDAVTLWHNRF